MEESGSTRPRCRAHGLATGPDGRCALCKRVSSAPPVAPAEVVYAERGAGVATTLLGAGALVAAAAALAFALSVSDDARSAREPGMLPHEVAPRPHAEPTQQLQRKGDQSDPRARLEQPAQPPPRAQQRPDDPAAPTAAELAERAREERAREQRAREEALQDQRRKQMIESEWQQRSARQARDGIQVVMYSTSWCPSCVAARTYMDREGIAYVEHDIDQNASARAAMRQLNPRGSVPTIDVEGEILVGFGAVHLEHALDKAARKRAGI